MGPARSSCMDKCVCFSFLFVMSLMTINSESSNKYNDESISLRISSLHGRPLLLIQGSDILLRRVNKAGRSNRSGRLEQLLIRVKTEKRQNILSELKGKCIYLRYLPYDTYLAVINTEYLKEILSLDGVVDVFTMPGILKLSDQLYKESRKVETKHSKTVSDPQPDRAKTFSVLTTAGAGVSLLCESVRKAGASCKARRDSESKYTVSVAVSSQSEFLDGVTRQPWVLWVEEQLPKTLRNKFASGLVQSSDWSNGTTRYLWDHGLTGVGEIIGADTRAQTHARARASARMHSHRVADTRLIHENCRWRPADERQRVVRTILWRQGWRTRGWTPRAASSAMTKSRCPYAWAWASSRLPDASTPPTARSSPMCVRSRRRGRARHRRLAAGLRHRPSLAPV